MKVTTFTKVLFATIMACALAVTAFAGFAKKNTYNGNFADVKQDAWYAKEVAAAYELGFVEGVSDTAFSPDTTVTVAQGITMAARVHAQYYGKTIAQGGSNWYDAYVKYATENGIMYEGQFDSLTRELKRREMAELFYNAVDKEYYTAINDVDFIPDVPIGSAYFAQLRVLYNAGILTGSDEYGSFYPDSAIKRSECSAIISRVALKENRKQVELADFTSDNAYVLCYNVGTDGYKEDISSGWILDNSGASVSVDGKYRTTFMDVSEEYGSNFTREFNFISCGEIVLETDFTSTAATGTYLEYRDVDENSVYKLKNTDGVWGILLENGKYEAFTDVPAGEDGKVKLRAVINLDTNKSTTYINDKLCGTHTLLSDNILSYRIGIDEKGTGDLQVGTVNMVANYGLYENFDLFDTNSIYGWETSGEVATNNKELNLKGGKVKKSFSAMSGVVCTETYFIAPEGADFALNIGDVLAVESKNGKLTAQSQEFYNLTKNMWYRLRIEADTEKATADIYLNSKKLGQVKTNGKNPVSFVEISGTGALSLDEVKVYNLYEYDDYVPAPKNKASLDDYIVGINICSLWRNGVHYGWACISAYEEPTPVIGYYDEGNPETADWEIKFMVEHGIDVQAFCWYANVDKGPIKDPNFSDHLHDGFMMAKYSDYMKFCLLWEASNASKFNSEQFRNYIVPYWFENYFLDPRYLTIDNMLVLPTYKISELTAKNAFGSIEGLKNELQYLNNKAKEYGFDGVLFLANSSSNGLASMGFVGSFSYGWGVDSKSYDYNVSSIQKSANIKTMHTIPTASVGFDSIPWLHERWGSITPEDFRRVLGWMKNEYLPKYEDSKYDWADKFVWMSTWNEYGEGTYISPAGLCGFGYLDAIKAEYTNDHADCNDVVPTLKQKERITHLYPQYATLLRRQGWYYYDIKNGAKVEEAENKLYVDGFDVLSYATAQKHIPAVEKNGKVYFPFNPSTGIDKMLGAEHFWRREAGTLEVRIGDNTILYEVNSRRYFVNGVQKLLDAPVELFDGLPMLDFAQFASDMGLGYEQKGKDLYIYTKNNEYIESVRKDRRLGNWEFNIDYDAEGWAQWSNNTLDIEVKDGIATFTTTGTTTDPIAAYKKGEFPEDFYTGKFTHLEIKCKYDYKADAPSHIDFFYITDIDGTYDEKKCLRIDLTNYSTEGEWVTFTIDLSKHKRFTYAERLTGLRFDPFNGLGTMQVDYIRFIENKDFVYVPKSERKVEIINGNADDDLNLFNSPNANITRVEDPDKKGNYVWKVTPKTNGSVYTYMKHFATFHPGKTYKIEFDIKLDANSAGAKSTRLYVNMQYPDKGALNDNDHIVSEFSLSSESGWFHFSGEHTPKKVDNYDKYAQFAIYSDPQNEAGFTFYVDNITVTEK